MIEILQFEHEKGAPMVRLGCTCGDAALAAYQCDDDQIIFCTHCGEITSRARLRNEVTLAQQYLGDWKWANVADREDCPLVNVSIPVLIGFDESAMQPQEALPGCVTKLSTDHCLIRMQDDPRLRSASLPLPRLVLFSEHAPLTGRMICELQETVTPHGSEGPAYYKLKMLPASREQGESVREFYQTACGLRFDWRVLLHGGEDKSRALRRMLLDCLPLSRVEVANTHADCVRQIREHRYDVLVIPPKPEFMQLIREKTSFTRKGTPRVIALLLNRTAGEISGALRWGAHEILHADCGKEELAHALQRCLESWHESEGPLPPNGMLKHRGPARKIAHAPSKGAAGDEETIQLLLMASETHDPHSSNHLKRIAAYCAAITQQIGWESERVAQIATASKLHDVGKIGVPDEILRKTGALTEDERRIMQQHSRFGFQLLSGGQSALVQLGALIALRHHERFDGQGYPDRVAGEAIPIEARVVSIADVFDALTSARPYKPAWTNERAIEFVVENAGKMFDARVVEAFRRALPEIRKSQLAFLDDFRDIWTERRQHTRHPIEPVQVSMEVAMPEQTFRPYQLTGHLTNLSAGGLKVKVTNVSNDLFQMLVSTRRYGKIYCEDNRWVELNNVACEVVWIDYYAIPDPNACIMGISFHKDRPNVLDTLQTMATTALHESKQSVYAGAGVIA